MSEGTFRVEGEVVGCHRGGHYKVRLDNDHEIIAHLSGRLYRNNIWVIVGDRVIVEMTGYDLGRGRIVYRDKAPHPASTDMRIA
jgi:translation initiation factor IF-1